jgi:hypothetical protein
VSWNLFIITFFLLLSKEEKKLESGDELVELSTLSRHLFLIGHKKMFETAVQVFNLYAPASTCEGKEGFARKVCKENSTSNSCVVKHNRFLFFIFYFVKY